VIDGRLADFYREMRDRDEKLTNDLHRRITRDLDRHAENTTRHIDRQVDQLRQHFTTLLHTALNGRHPQ
jgi:hypothetical protein